MLKQAGKISLRFLLLAGCFLLIYLAAAYSLPCLKVNKEFRNEAAGIKIFVISNGVHTDIALPATTSSRNWTRSFPPDSFDVKNPSFSYIAFGWGDRGFYLDTPTWDDLTFGTAFKACFGLSSTAMHVRYLREPVRTGERCVSLTVDEKCYRALSAYIEEGFVKKNGSPLRIGHPGYGNFDRFYEAQGTYSLFKTCNVWTNNGLKAAGIGVCAWSPFEKGLMRSLR